MKVKVTKNQLSAAEAARVGSCREYMPNPEAEDISEDECLQGRLTPHTLTPSYHGRECLGNGEWPGYECQCDECPHYLTCFPEFDK